MLTIGNRRQELTDLRWPPPIFNRIVSLPDSPEEHIRYWTRLLLLFSLLCSIQIHLCTKVLPYSNLNTSSRWHESDAQRLVYCNALPPCGTALGHSRSLWNLLLVLTDYGLPDARGLWSASGYCVQELLLDNTIRSVPKSRASYLPGSSFDCL